MRDDDDRPSVGGRHLGGSARWHLHPCSTPSCLNKIACDGFWSRNFDGWPEALCSIYHEDQGGVAYCPACLDRQELEQARAQMLEHDTDPRRI